MPLYNFGVKSTLVVFWTVKILLLFKWNYIIQWQVINNLYFFHCVPRKFFTFNCHSLVIFTPQSPLLPLIFIHLSFLSIFSLVLSPVHTLLIIRLFNSILIIVYVLVLFSFLWLSRVLLRPFFLIHSLSSKWQIIDSYTLHS